MGLFSLWAPEMWFGMELLRPLIKNYGVVDCSLEKARGTVVVALGRKVVLTWAPTSGLFKGRRTPRLAVASPLSSSTPFVHLFWFRDVLHYVRP